MLDERLKIKDERCFELSSWRPVGLIGSIALLFAFLFLSACTDYVSKIDDQIAELNAYQDEDLTELSSDSRDESSDKTKKSSSSSKKNVSSSSAVNPSSSSGVALSEGDGSLTDSRDGQVYKTVKIGSQTWMAENLNYETSNSYCKDDKSANCEKYGRLYTWATAMDSAGMWSSNGKGCGYGKTCSPTYPVRGVCPSGWHLPTKTEFETLFTAVGGQSVAGTKLKSTSGWKSNGNGSDAYSFSALPVSFRYGSGNYGLEGNYADFWSSTEDGGYYAYPMAFSYGSDKAFLTSIDKDYGYSVRCVRDEMSKENSSSSAVNPSSSSGVTLSEGDGSLTDSRDGQVYKTVKIGSQTWMAENLNYKTAESYCYDDKSANCEKYGRLYTWAAAKKACPTGWHLPNNDEWNTLITAVGGQSTAGKMLKSTSGWNGRNGSGNGTDDYSFSALPAGYRGNDGDYNDAGGYANIWSSSEYDSNIAYGMFLDYYSDATHLYDDPKVEGFSVRCVKD